MHPSYLNIYIVYYTYNQSHLKQFSSDSFSTVLPLTMYMWVWEKIGAYYLVHVDLPRQHPSAELP